MNQLEVGVTVHFMVDALSVSNLHKQKIEDLLNSEFIYFFLFYATVTVQFQRIRSTDQMILVNNYVIHSIYFFLSFVNSSDYIQFIR